jgi:hypothetical protein
MAIEDPVLGTLREEGPRLDGGFLHEGKPLSLGLYPDGEDVSETIETARKLVSSVHAIDAKARDAVVAKLLSTYNENWRNSEEVDDDDNLVSVEDPVLSGEEFLTRISLYAINVTGSNTCDLFYNDGDMFGGHSIVVGSFDARKFEDLDVRLYG